MTTRSISRAGVVVVVASVDARDTVSASLTRFVEEAGDPKSVVLVDASRDGTADLVQEAFPNLPIIRRAHGALVPELWREGLLATNAPVVAFSTAAMIPGRGWLDALLDQLESTGAAAVGGPIVPAEGLRAFDRAVYLARYVQYRRPIQSESELILPGENAAYRRRQIVESGLIPADGFWEVEIQRLLRAKGERMEWAPGPSVTYHGGSRPVGVLHQRFRHARRHAASRVKDWGPVERLVRTMATPLVPPLLLRRAVKTLREQGSGLRLWWLALPSLFLLLTAWSLGEASGMLFYGVSTWPKSMASTAHQWKTRWTA
jgi:hypothetical protein